MGDVDHLRIQFQTLRDTFEHLKASTFNAKSKALFTLTESRRIRRVIRRRIRRYPCHQSTLTN